MVFGTQDRLPVSLLDVHYLRSRFSLNFTSSPNSSFHVGNLEASENLLSLQESLLAPPYIQLHVSKMALSACAGLRFEKRFHCEVFFFF